MVNFMAAMWFRIGAVALMLSAVPAYACTCGGGNTSSCEVPPAGIIVRATVVSIEFDQIRPSFAPPVSSGTPQRMSRPPGAIPTPEPWGRVKVTLSVSERFRGVAGDTIVIRTGLGEDDCGYPFEVGH